MSLQCPEGIVAVSRNTLRILALERLGTVFNTLSTPLKYTPRRFVVDESMGIIIVAEGDHNVHDDESKRLALAADDDDADNGEMALDEGELDEKAFGASKAGKGKWSAALSIVDPLQVLFPYTCLGRTRICTPTHTPTHTHTHSLSLSLFPSCNLALFSFFFFFSKGTCHVPSATRKQ